MGTLFVSSNLFTNSVLALLAHKDLVSFGMEIGITCNG
jgi:hypothetical protein